MWLGASRGFSQPSLPPPFPGFVLKFNDDFTSFTGGPTGTTSGWETCRIDGTRHNPDNGAQEYSGDATIGINPFSIVGSNLIITASKASVTGANPAGQLYNSGTITSAASFHMQYGYFEIRSQVPAGAGLWPAFWMENVDESGNFEIDLYEFIGNPTSLFETMHYSVAGNGTQDQRFVTLPFDASTAMHVYGIDWEPTGITTYIDGIAQQTWAGGLGGMNQAAHIIIDNGVGGFFPGNPDPGATYFPSLHIIDYVRAWASPNSINIGGTRAL